jgi:beta-aspartyl-dipeptidase (metallo-type)
VPLSLFTRAGVTSVVGVLGTDDTTRDTRSLVAQAYALREQGLNAWCHTGGYHVPPVNLTGSVRDDIVFIDPVIGVGELAISDHRSSQPTLDELLRIASDVHVAGLISGKAGILHLHLGDGSRGLAAVRKMLTQSELPARIFNPTHVNRRSELFAEALDLASRGVVIDVTAFPVADDDDALSAAAAIERYIAAGLPPANITVSSDGGGCLPVFNAQGEMTSMDIGSPACLAVTLSELLQRGLALQDVLPVFTSNVARLLRLPRKGRIEAGRDADLIVLDGDDAIDSVMVGGDWHVRDGEQRIFGRFENG